MIWGTENTPDYHKSIAKDFSQYEVMAHGSRRITLRNRKFLCRIKRPQTPAVVATAPYGEPILLANIPNVPQPEPSPIQQYNQEEFYTPDQSPVMSRSQSQENIAQGHNKPVDEEPRDVLPEPEPVVNAPQPLVHLRRSSRASKEKDHQE